MKNLRSFLGRKRFLPLCAIALVVAISFGLGSCSDPNSGTDPGSDAYTVSGKITLSGGSGTLTNASVKLMQGSVEKGSGAPNANGSYSFANVAAGNGYTVTASLSGYTTNATGAFNVSGNVADRNITLTASGGNNDITYTIAADGADSTTTSTQLTFTFSADPTGLTAADITVSGSAAKATDAALSGTGTTRTLAITVSTAGIAMVNISKTGIERGQKSVTVHKQGETAPTATVNSVTVAPATASVAKGETQQFTATVSGNNLADADKGVTWSITTAGIAKGTSIDNTGLLTVAAAETQTSLEVKAVSTKDTTKFGASTVTITDGSNPLPAVSTPTADPIAGPVASGTEITLTTSTDGATIYYTTDTSTPTASSTAYSNASKPRITTATTLKAIAVKDGMTDSDVLTAAYTVTMEKVATPTADPIAGAVASGTEITLTTDTSGATIYYTTNGSTPTAGSTTYSDASKPRITAAATIKAIAVKDGMTNSDVLTAEYTMSGPSQTITVGYDRGTITITDADGAAVTSISLSKSGALSSITLSADGTFTGVTWYVNGKSVSYNPDPYLALNAASYAAKTHSVTFTGWRNGSYLSSAPIPFTVTN